MFILLSALFLSLRRLSKGSNSWQRSHHGESNVCFFERRSVIRSISGDSHDFLVSVEVTVDDPFDEDVLVLGWRASHHSEGWPNLVDQLLSDLLIERSNVSLLITKLVKSIVIN